MTLAFEIKRRARHVIGPVIGCLLLGYFIFHAVEGDRGVYAWRALDSKIEAAETELALLDEEREALERKVAMLHPDSIDPDLLTEQARHVLHYLARDEFTLTGLVGAVEVKGGERVAREGEIQAISIASDTN